MIRFNCTRDVVYRDRSKTTTDMSYGLPGYVNGRTKKVKSKNAVAKKTIKSETSKGCKWWIFTVEIVS